MGSLGDLCIIYIIAENLHHIALVVLRYNTVYYIFCCFDLDSLGFFLRGRGWDKRGNLDAIILLLIEFILLLLLSLLYR